MRFKTTVLCILLLTLCCAPGCKKWDDHTSIPNQDLTMNLTDAIAQRQNLSKFHEYLQKTGLDKELSSSKEYTVWAPVNDALQTLDPAIVADSSRLRQFLANHISFTKYFTRNAASAIRVPMLNGKRNSFLNNKLEDANITEADKVFANGVLHVIDKPVLVLPNAWELVNNTRSIYQQSTFILSLTRNVFDPANAIIDSINSQTGKPVYRPGTDSILRNTFNVSVSDLQDEEKQYTYFILNDAAFNAEILKLNSYYKTSTADSTKNLASNNVVKDLIVEGVYPLDQLPAFLTSKFGVKIPIDKSKVIEVRKMSNGIAYVMSGINFDVKEKIPPVFVQGEDYRAFLRPDSTVVSPTQNNTSAVFVRVRLNPETGLQFKDIFVYGHGIAGLNAQYQVSNLPSVKYKVYWVAANDTIRLSTAQVNPVVFNQRLAMGDRTSTTFAYVPVAINNYNEVYLGDYTQSVYGRLNMFLIANTSGTTTLTLDYIKLVPDI